MIKPNAVRRKAQDCMKKGDWSGAIKEYKRLLEVDQNNPNILNELGDLYIKVADKQNAYKMYENAIDAYARVSLHNNAVAVCKKVLRVIPTNVEVLFKLGKLRQDQGFQREATSHFLAYLDKIVTDVSYEPEQLKTMVLAVVDVVPDNPEVLKQIGEFLIKWEFESEAVTVLVQLQQLYNKNKMEDQSNEIGKRLEMLGYNPDEKKPADTSPPQPEREKAQPKVEEKGKEESLLSSLDLEGDSQTPPSVDGIEHHNVQLEGSSAEPQPTTQGDSQTAVETVYEIEPEKEEQPAPQVSAKEESKVEVTGSQKPEPKAKKKDGVVHVSQIIDEFKSEIKESLDEEDYKSHYDLGMAYLEMDLLPEAIREFQMASNSTHYQVRSLEMIGLCFLKQNQPRLAVKQLEKGLALVGNQERDALGIRYDLAVAYEMLGDIEKAQHFFEEVYVIDVAFRDVSEKIKKYTK